MRTATIAILILSLFTPRAMAQGPNESWDNLRQLRPGQKIEVVDMKLRSLKGEFVGVSEDSVTLRRGKQEASVARTEVFRVSLRENSKRGRNTLIGLAIGAAAGLAAGVAYCHGDCDLERGVAWVLPGMLGSGIGAGIGAAFPGSRTIYRAPNRNLAPAP